MVRVTTHTGIVEGYMQNGIATFLAVPYAAPISTANRFAAPRPPTPWAGIRQCIRPGAVCPQIPTYGPVGRNATSSLAAGEDFLTLNIRTPALSGRAPVLVWLHGGGYAMGSANEPQFQTGAFARSGIVEVCANYRLGALGFLPMGAACPTNRGLLDIISALEWVRDQIALFGGDPERVVLAGRSAGGFAVSTLLAMPAAHGLFARALIQSGATSAVLSPHDGQRTTRRFMEALGQPDPAELEGMDIGRMLHAQRSICEESYEQHDFGRDGSVTMVGIPFQPVIDGTTLPDHPETLARQGRMARVPVMIGTTSAEYMTHSTAHPDLASWAQVIALLDQRVQPMGLSGAEIVGRYRQALPGHDVIGIWRAVGGDLVFQNPTTRLGLLLSKYQPVYKYLFGGIGPDETGAAHGAEVGCVWFNPDLPSGGLPPRFQVRDRSFAARVHAQWVSFIQDKIPFLPRGPWAAYNATTRQVAHITPTGTQMRSDPFYERCMLWEPVAPGHDGQASI